MAAAGLSVMLAGCQKQVAVMHPPPPPPPVATAPAAAPTQQASAARTPQSQPVSATPNAATQARIQELLDRIQDAYFDYDQHSLRPDAQTTLQADATDLRQILVQFPNYKLTVEGFCDERGSDAYNLALGDARAKKAKEFLENLGLPASQLRTVSFGKERPVCTEQTEACWQKNRRAHITQDQNVS
jgi:peptidoglycan-associated lipoprotein